MHYSKFQSVSAWQPCRSSSSSVKLSKQILLKAAKFVLLMVLHGNSKGKTRENGGVSTGLVERGEMQIAAEQYDPNCRARCRARCQRIQPQTETVFYFPLSASSVAFSSVAFQSTKYKYVHLTTLRQTLEPRGRVSKSKLSFVLHRQQ
jgi:hypothetical protein